jgi:Na+-translocating ferredoxin:NAD+ oxidoreductase RnfC subunit
MSTIEQIAQAGVVGAGGAGFPTHVKLAAKADTVLINAAECEPLLHKDKEVLRRFPDEVLAGLSDAMRLTGAQRGVVGIKEKYRDVIKMLGPKLGAGMSICPLTDAYPSGDEFVLVYEATGRVVPPGGIPLNVGAVVINVETAYNVARAAREPVTETFLTVAGAVRTPVTLRVPVGVPMSACVAAAGGPTCDAVNYVVGGVMMGWVQPDLDTPVDKTTGGIIVLDDTHVVVRRRKADWKQIARVGRSACDQCSFCTELCPRYLLGHPIEPHRAMRSLMFNRVGEADTRGTSFCCECNLCSLYACPEDLDPRNVCVQNKRKILAAGPAARWQDPPFNPGRAETLGPGRKAPTKRLMRKLGLLGFENVGPLVDATVPARRVGIKLKQHVGAPCEPTVKPGQKVKRGEPVARPAVKDGKPALGALVHASIDGEVTAVENGIIWIEDK